jgi:hypothetical protein
MELTQDKLKELSRNLDFINAYEWEWDYYTYGNSDITQEYEVCVYDDDENDYYFMCSVYLNRNLEGELTDFDISVLSCYDSQGNHIEIDNLNLGVFIDELIEVINC